MRKKLIKQLNSGVVSLVTGWQPGTGVINGVKSEPFCHKAKRNLVQPKAVHDLWQT